MAKEKEFKISLTGMTQGYITAETEEQAVKHFLRQLIITTNKGKTYKDFKILGPFDLIEIEGGKNE